MADIKVKDLTDTSSITLDNQVMVLTNDAQNQVQNITVENLLTNVLSSDNGNVLEQGTDGKLYVETPENITGELSDLTTTEKTSLVGAINEVNSDLATEITNRTNAVSGEATTRANADNNLQTQIDAITAASDVTDIVGTYAELQAYDTAGLPDNSIIKVLQDESRQNETTYYRWVITDGVGAWVLIGEEGPYYTISQADSKFATQETVGNLNNLATSDKSSVVNAMNELASVLDPTQTADYIKNSKAIYSGEVSENALILPQIKEMAHSTFDRSKFTVVGSPVITDDGIASGFSSSNYLQILDTFNPQGSWEIALSVNETSAPLNSHDSYYIGNLEPNNKRNIVIGMNASGNFKLWLSSDGTSWDIVSGITIPGTIKQYTLLKVGFDGTKYYFEKSLDGEIWLDREEIVSSLKIYQAPLLLGTAFASDFYTKGSIDLKQFSITVDGVEVFSGNKTGIDTIKPDDYTVVGTPTISADGVASGFSASNYINTIQLSELAGKSWDIEDVFEYIPVSSGNALVLGLTSTYAVRGSIFYNSLGNVLLGAYIGVTGDATSEGPKITLSNVLTNAGKYYYKLSFDIETGKYTLSIYNSNHILINSGEYTPPTTNKQLWDINNNPTTYISVGRFLAGTASFTGSVDLNAFKIYAEGNLVYQPCLKIPYTESFTGSKIAQAIYRDRVKDAYEQGYHQYSYYTLSDTDFTLPMGEVYGMIGRLDKLLNNEIGLPIPTLSNTLNENEIWLEGAEVSKTTYWKLYNIYGDSYGTPDSADNFVLPNFRNRTLWGADSFGYISAGLPNITGYLDVFTSSGVQQNGALSKNISSERNPGGGDELGWGTIQFDASRSSSVYGNSTTVRPPAIKVRYKTRYC